MLPRRLLEIFDTVINVLCYFKSKVKRVMRQHCHLNDLQLFLGKASRSGCCFVLLFGLCLSKMSFPLRLAFHKRSEGEELGQESGMGLPGGPAGGGLWSAILSSSRQHLQVPRKQPAPSHPCWLELLATKRMLCQEETALADSVAETSV